MPRKAPAGFSPGFSTYTGSLLQAPEGRWAAAERPIHPRRTPAQITVSREGSRCSWGAITKLNCAACKNTVVVKRSTAPRWLHAAGPGAKSLHAIKAAVVSAGGAALAVQGPLVLPSRPRPLGGSCVPGWLRACLGCGSMRKEAGWEASLG